MSEWAPFVPLFQTVLWVLLIVLAIIVFRKKLHDLFDAAKKRVEEGSSFEAGPVKIGPRPELEKLPYATPSGESRAEAAATAPGSPHAELGDAREALYERNRRVFLVHEIAPTTVPRQRYDVFIYLAGHGDDGEANLETVQKTEFFLGRHFGNKVIIGSRTDGVVGMRTSAYGEFLCVCRVTFDDGATVLLDRYIDFSMGDRVDAVARNAR